MHIGFTGTREGMTAKQVATFVKLLTSDLFKGREVHFHHGDCVGSDEKADQLVRVFTNAKIVIHPPTDKKLAANCGLLEERLPPKPYLERNRAIVDACELLIATPSTNQPKKRGSGTWHTIRYALNSGKRFIIIWPDGYTKEYNEQVSET